MSFQYPAAAVVVAAIRPSTTYPAKGTPPILWPPPANPSSLQRPSNRYALRSAFLSTAFQLLHPPPPATAGGCGSRPGFSMRVASRQAYICRDCGYIYNERTPFDKLPDKFFCPVCGAPKRRFRVYEPAVAKNVNDINVRKARKEQIKRDEAVGRAFPVAVILGVAGLAGLYFYLNNVY
ncbi:ferredoxin-nitrite reductase [Apostasia shenzhenica]|uniref:Ferredoxin-nitrite reductase n=1 Tax=Apostasia shenzhenica TaxID=1088818 RepID=A0A2I0ATQ1_9ASPA|nr:ferredoxin-nitrite reductase [Apostasia shenzhenica]